MLSECVTTYPVLTRYPRYFISDLDYDDCVGISSGYSGSDG